MFSKSSMIASVSYFDSAQYSRIRIFLVARLQFCAHLWKWIYVCIVWLIGLQTDVVVATSAMWNTVSSENFDENFYNRCGKTFAHNANLQICNKFFKGENKNSLWWRHQGEGGPILNLNTYWWRNTFMAHTNTIHFSI